MILGTKGGGPLDFLCVEAGFWTRSMLASGLGGNFTPPEVTLPTVVVAVVDVTVKWACCIIVPNARAIKRILHRLRESYVCRAIHATPCWSPLQNELSHSPVVLVEMDLVGTSSELNPGGRRSDRSSFLMSPKRLAKDSLGTPEDLVVVGSLVVVVFLVVEGGCSLSWELALKPGGRNWATLSYFTFWRLCKDKAGGSEENVTHV